MNPSNVGSIFGIEAVHNSGFDHQIPPNPFTTRQILECHSMECVSHVFHTANGRDGICTVPLHAARRTKLRSIWGAARRHASWKNAVFDFDMYVGVVDTDTLSLALTRIFFPCLGTALFHFHFTNAVMRRAVRLRVGTYQYTALPLVPSHPAHDLFIFC